MRQRRVVVGERLLGLVRARRSALPRLMRAWTWRGCRASTASKAATASAGRLRSSSTLPRLLSASRWPGASASALSRLASASSSRLSACSTSARFDSASAERGCDLERRGDQAIGLAGLAALVVEHAEQMQRVEIVALRLQHAGVELLRLVEAALPMQRERLAAMVCAEVERAGLRPSVTAGWSGRSAASRRPASRRRPSVLSASAARAAGRSRQRVSQAFRFGTALKVHVDRAADDGGDVEIGDGEVVAEQIGLLPRPRASSTLNGATSTFSASARLAASRSAGGRRTACSDQMLTPRSTSVTAHRLHCQALRLAFQRAGIEPAERNASWRDRA